MGGAGSHSGLHQSEREKEGEAKPVLEAPQRSFWLYMGSATLLCAFSIVLYYASNTLVLGQNETIDALPVVDLGYARYRPTTYNEQAQYYNFSNIRYAAPPVGNLRWRDPQPPKRDRATINDGSVGYVCPQAGPNYFADAAAGTPDKGASVPPAVSGQTENEDCLFLDVVTPKPVYERAQVKGGKLAPVLVNIHGGGDFSGDKFTIYWPGGLLERSKNGIVYVSMNYRLGAFGFLSTLQDSPANQTSANAGLLDQRFALKWIRQNIHLFGGDPEQVTVIGESAGGTNIAFHVTAFGGAKPEEQLFKQAIIQSTQIAAGDPILNARGANQFLRAAGVSSVDEARKLPTEDLIKANKQANLDIPSASTYFGPTIDGSLVQDQPALQLKAQKFYNKISMITSSNAFEGLLFSNKSIKTDADYNDFVNNYFPSASPQFRAKVIQDLYPAKYDGSQGYRDVQGRTVKTITEVLFGCTTYIFGTALKGATHNLFFDIPPAYHAEDLAYTWYPTGTIPNFKPDLAKTLQQFYVNFVMNGSPGRGWPVYGSGAQSLQASTLKDVTSQYKNERCNYLAGAPYAAPKSSRPAVDVLSR